MNQLEIRRRAIGAAGPGMRGQDARVQEMPPGEPVPQDAVPVELPGDILIR